MSELLESNTVTSKPRLLQGLPEMDGPNKPRRALQYAGFFIVQKQHSSKQAALILAKVRRCVDVSLPCAYQFRVAIFHVRTYLDAVIRAYPARERTEIGKKTANYLLLFSTSGATRVFGNPRNAATKTSPDQQKITSLEI